MADLDEKGVAKMAKKNREGDSVLWALESLRDRHKRLGQHDSAAAVSNAITWVKRAACAQGSGGERCGKGRYDEAEDLSDNEPKALNHDSWETKNRWIDTR